MDTEHQLRRKVSVTLDTYGHLVKDKGAEAARAIEGLLK